MNGVTLVFQSFMNAMSQIYMYIFRSIIKRVHHKNKAYYAIIEYFCVVIATLSDTFKIAYRIRNSYGSTTFMQVLHNCNMQIFVIKITHLLPSL